MMLPTIKAELVDGLGCNIFNLPLFNRIDHCSPFSLFNLIVLLLLLLSTFTIHHAIPTSLVSFSRCSYGPPHPGLWSHYGFFAR